jgi:hypothetical protein
MGLVDWQNATGPQQAHDRGHQTNNSPASFCLSRLARLSVSSLWSVSRRSRSHPQFWPFCLFRLHSAFTFAIPRGANCCHTAPRQPRERVRRDLLLEPVPLPCPSRATYLQRGQHLSEPSSLVCHISGIGVGVLVDPRVPPSRQST